MYVAELTPNHLNYFIEMISKYSVNIKIDILHFDLHQVMKPMVVALHRIKKIYMEGSGSGTIK